MDHRSLEDKILKQDLSRQPDSDEGGDLVDTDDESDVEDPFAEELAAGAPEGFGKGNDGLAPLASYAGASGKTGPKGVLADYRLAQADLKRRREREQLRRVDLFRALGDGVMTSLPSTAASSDAEKLARKIAMTSLDEERDAVAAAARAGSASESDDDEFGDDDFIKSFRAKRLAQMKAAASRPTFGEVKEIGKFDLVTETDDEDPSVWVVVHLYENFDEGCRAINKSLPAVARAHPHIKFLTLVASQATDTLDHVALPVLMFFKAGKTVHACVRASDHIGAKPTPDDIEWFLAKLKVIEDPGTGAPGTGSGAGTGKAPDTDDDDDEEDF